MLFVVLFANAALADEYDLFDVGVEEGVSDVYDSSFGEEVVFSDSLDFGNDQAESGIVSGSDSVLSSDSLDQVIVIVVTPEPSSVPDVTPTPEPVASSNPDLDSSDYDTVSNSDLLRVLELLASTQVNSGVVGDDEESDELDEEAATSSPVPTEDAMDEADELSEEAEEDDEADEDDEVIDVEEDVEYMTFEDELLNTLGYVKGFLLFFVVVVLCFFTYKFFRIFF